MVLQEVQVVVVSREHQVRRGLQGRAVLTEHQVLRVRPVLQVVQELAEVVVPQGHQVQAEHRGLQVHTLYLNQLNQIR